MTSMGISSYFPNVIELIFGENEFESNDIPDSWRNYGFSSENFFYNTGACLFGICLFCCLLLASGVKALLKNPGVLRSFKYNAFIRLWIEVYFEFLIGAVISLGATISYIKTNEIAPIGTMVGTIVFIFLLVTPVFSLLLLLKLKKTIPSLQLDALDKVNVLFSEFNLAKSKNSMLFYPFFFLRRLLYMLNLFFLADYVILQVSINLALSIAQSLFLIFMVRFSSNFGLLISISVELGICSIYVFSGWMHLHESDTVRAVLSTMMMVAVLVTVLISYLPVLYEARVVFHRKTKNSVMPAADAAFEESGIFRGFSHTPVYALKSENPELSMNEVE